MDRKAAPLRRGIAGYAGARLDGVWIAGPLRYAEGTQGGQRPALMEYGSQGRFALRRVQRRATRRFRRGAGADTWILPATRAPAKSRPCMS